MRFAEPRRRLPVFLAGALLMGGCAGAGGGVGAVPVLAKHEQVLPPSPEVQEEDDEDPAEPLFARDLVEHAREDVELDCETVPQLASLGYFLGSPETCDEEK